jgi:hypothetical protein
MQRGISTTSYLGEKTLAELEWEVQEKTIQQADKRFALKSKTNHWVIIIVDSDRGDYFCVSHVSGECIINTTRNIRPSYRNDNRLSDDMR